MELNAKHASAFRGRAERLLGVGAEGDGVGSSSLRENVVAVRELGQGLKAIGIRPPPFRTTPILRHPVFSLQPSCNI